jgi:archaellum component FlaC
MSDSKTRFNTARRQLSNALQQLEQITIQKIHEATINSKMLDVADEDFGELKTKIIEQTSIAQNLSEEINKLQKTLEEIGQENEFLTKKNKLLADKNSQLKSCGSSIIEAIESDLIKISKIITTAK